MLNEQDIMEDDDLTIFIRLGSDFNENYYTEKIALKYHAVPVHLNSRFS